MRLEEGSLADTEIARPQLAVGVSRAGVTHRRSCQVSFACVGEAHRLHFAVTQTRGGCIDRGYLDTAVRRIGHLHLRAEAAARVGRGDRMQFADFVGRRGLSNRHELGVVDRNSRKSTSKPLACLN